MYEEQPEVVNHGQVLAYLLVNINAGSDTVSAKTKTLFYNPLKRPDTMDQLMEELDEALKGGNLIVPYPRCQGVNGYTTSRRYA